MNRLIAILVVALAMLAAGLPVHAAVANDTSDTPTFRIEVPDGMDGLGDALREAWPGVRESVGKLIGVWHNGDVYCFVARNTDGMRDILIRLGMPGVRLSPNIAGLAIPSRSLLLLNVSPHTDGPVITRMLETFRHEYCHLVMGMFAERAGARWPSWFEEGVCQWVQQSGYQPGEAVKAAREGRIRLPSLEEVSERIDARDDRTGAAYAFSQNAVGYLLRGMKEDPSGVIARLGERYVALEGDFDAAFADTFGESVSVYERRWREHASASGFFDGLWMFIVHHHITLMFGACGLIMLIGLVLRWRARRRFMQRAEQVPPGGFPDGVAVLTVGPDGRVVESRDPPGNDTPHWSPAAIDPEGLLAAVKQQRREQHERNRLAKLARKARRDGDDETEARP